MGRSHLVCLDVDQLAGVLVRWNVQGIAQSTDGRGCMKTSFKGLLGIGGKAAMIAFLIVGIWVVFGHHR
jgi:hypothetical protein